MKIENTSKHTYLAFSDHQHFVLKISSVEKRKLQKYFRAVGKPKLFIYLTFAALIILLLKNFKSKHYQAIVDVEYPGRNNLIKSFIKLYGQGLSIKDISFHQIGKKSRAHYLASGTAIKKLSPDMIVNAKQVLKIIRKTFDKVQGKGKYNDKNYSSNNFFFRIT